jgi:Serine dehydrogenase proteinase
MTTQVWLLIQPGKREHEVSAGTYAELSKDVRTAYFSQRRRLSKPKQVVLLIDSTGGSAKSGYQLAMFFRQYCRRFVALVPNVAKSAATLLAIGADEIILGNSGELGPVDAQVLEGTRYIPALDRVKALERLQAAALEAFDRTMALLTLRSEQNIDELIPIAANFAASLSEPYLQKQDMVEYTRMSRVLKIGEDYANRLLYRQGRQKSERQNGHRGTQEDHQPYPQREEGMVESVALEEEWLSNYSDPRKRSARALAQHLVGAYPDHDFAVDAEEARRIGLPVRSPSPQMGLIIDELYQALADRSQEGLTAIGRLKEA